MRINRAKNSITTAVAAAVLIAALSPRASHAAEPPRPGCRPASKLEYQSAKRQYLLRNRFGEYLRTGRLWHRSYWYCPG